MSRTAVVWILMGVAACGGGDDGGDDGGGLPKARYTVGEGASLQDIGEVYAFNASGHFVSNSPRHGPIVADLETRVFTQITRMSGFVGFDDAGDLLCTQDNGVIQYFLRTGNGAGSEVEIQRLLPGGIPFAPFALANDGGVWGTTLEAHAGEPATPGYGRYATDHVERFRDWGSHDPTQLAQARLGVDTMDRAVFCETPRDGAGDNGLPQTHCRIVAADHTEVEIGRDVPDVWGIAALRPITPGGRLGGEVSLGDFGFDGGVPTLFDGATTEILGDELGEVLALNDRGDTIFNQLHVAQPVRVRNAAGEVADLTEYLRDPSRPNREVLGGEVLALAPDGRILVAHSVDGTDASTNVYMLTPE